ncbi:MAG: hypothetical protein JXL85_00630 [Bacilli bacterium]|nr:hypothetical protein [Bacilli bacterium]
MEKISIDDIVLNLIKVTKEKKLIWESNKDTSIVNFDFEFLQSHSLANKLDVYIAKMNGNVFYVFNEGIKEKKLIKKNIYVLIETKENGNLLFNEEMFNDKDLPNVFVNILNRNGKDEQDILDNIFKDLTD